MIDLYKPSVTKSCARCRARKVKCDLKLPRCSACTRQDEVCDITECVAYPYSLVESLHARICELEEKLRALTSNPSRNLDVASTAPDGERQQRGSEPLGWSADVSKEAEEVGVLAIGLADPYSHNKYVGSAAGSTFARIFFKQVNLDYRQDSSYHKGYSENSSPDQLATLPSNATARFILSTYIARVHLWWPFLHLPYLRSCFQRMYCNPRECESYDKFLVFMVLALGAEEAAESKYYAQMLDFNTSREYFQTGLHFFSRFSERPRDFRGLQAVLLLTIWMFNSSSPNHSNDLWHLTRYTMSIALELGIHRRSLNLGLSTDELETRTRTWWTIYSLERAVALITGRVLSVRDQAIDTPLPASGTLDELTTDEAKAAALFKSKSIWPFTHMIELRKMAGKVLESIYIARDPNGRCSSLTFQQACTISDELHQSLDRWKRQLDAAGIKPLREYSEMEIEYCMLLLHLNRPSPTFMIPSQQMVGICSNASSGALHAWAKIEAEVGISAICRCYRHFHDILIAGLASLYCRWHISKIAQNPPPSSTMQQDARICLDLLNKGILYLRNPLLSRFRNLFSALQAKVYSTINPPISSDLPSLLDPDGVTEGVNTDIDYWGLDGTMAFSGSDGLEAYLNQVSSIFDDGMLDVDDMLTAWYSSVLDESAVHEHAADARLGYQ